MPKMMEKNCNCLSWHFVLLDRKELEMEIEVRKNEMS